jgi:hypothetical protein
MAPNRSRTIRQRSRGVDPSLEALAWKAQERLHRFYKRMMWRGRDHNVVITAVARQLAGFIWAIGTKALELHAALKVSKLGYLPTPATRGGRGRLRFLNTRPVLPRHAIPGLNTLGPEWNSLTDATVDETSGSRKPHDFLKALIEGTTPDLLNTLLVTESRTRSPGFAASGRSPAGFRMRPRRR